MLNWSRLLAAVAIVAMCSAVAADRKVSVSLVVKSIPGTVQVCKDLAVCTVIVRIDPPAKPGDACYAFIDMETVRITKHTRVDFYLVHNKNDMETYTFYDRGIAFIGTQPTADQFAPVGLTTINGYQVAQWTTGNKKTADPLRYVPSVLRDSDGQTCAGGDPKIANDG